MKQIGEKNEKSTTSHKKSNPAVETTSPLVEKSLYDGDRLRLIN